MPCKTVCIVHILILPSEHYTTPLNPLGGIFQYHLAVLLRDYGNKVGIISAGFVPFDYQLKSYPYPDFEIRDEIPVFRKYIRTFIPGRYAIRYLQNLVTRQYVLLYERYVENYGHPDIIHAHNALYAGLAASKIKEKYKVPYVLTEHSSLYERAYLSNSQIDIAKRIQKQADERTFVSSRLAQKLRAIIGIEVEPYTVIFNVLEELFSSNIVAEKDVVNTNKFTFLSVGSLDTNKNHASLIRAFHQAFKGIKDVRLDIVGSGPMKNELQTLISQLQLDDKVHLLGPMGRNEVKMIMSRCHVFVLPSIIETFGVVLIEALALGKPVVSTYSGGPEDIVNSINGLLVAPEEDGELAAALTKIKNSYNRYNAEDISLDCNSRFGRDTFYKRLEMVYNRIK